MEMEMCLIVSQGIPGDVPIMLGCIVNGVKLPVICDLVGAPSGRIDQKCRGAAYPKNDWLVDAHLPWET
jgi:hypothetical protein